MNLEKYLLSEQFNLITNVEIRKSANLDISYVADTQIIELMSIQAYIFNIYLESKDRDEYLKKINLSLEKIMFNHLYRYIFASDFDSTLKFIQSRYIWNNTIINVNTKDELLFEARVIISDLIHGSSAQLQAFYKKEICSEFSVKPLFKLVELVNMIKSRTDFYEIKQDLK